MKTETHVGNAVLFLNGILMISVLTEPFGGWWWFWCGWGILIVVARIARNYLPGFWVYTRTPVRVIRNQMVAMHGVFGNKDFGQIAEVVVPRDQIDYSTWSYSDPRTVWDRCVTALVWLSSWYEDVDQIKKTAVVWRAAGMVWKNVFTTIYTKCCKKFQARKCR